MKSYFLLLAIGITTIVACNTDNKDPLKEEREKTASRVCGCITPLTNVLSPEAKRVFERSLKADNVEQVAEEEVSKLDSADQVKVAAQLEMIENAMESESSNLNKCLNEAMAGYTKKESKEPQKDLERFVDEMEKQKDCDLAALMMKAYVKKGTTEENK
jgi:hypothetical protein